MEEQSNPLWVLQRKNLQFVESENTIIHAYSNLLMFENKKVVNPFFISENSNNILFPTPDIMAVYQNTFKGDVDDKNTTYFSLMNFKTKKMKTFKFKLIIKHLYMTNEDQLFYINTQKVSMDFFSLAENTLKRRIPLKSVENIKYCAAPFIFQQTKHFCIIEELNGGISEISFYDYNQDANQKQPFSTYTAPVPVNKIFKLNRSSKIGWEVGKKLSGQLRIQTFVGTKKRTFSTQIYSFSLQNLIPKIELSQFKRLVIKKINQRKENDFLIKVQIPSENQNSFYYGSPNNNIKGEFILKTNGETQTINILEWTSEKKITHAESYMFKAKEFQTCSNYSYLIIQNGNPFINDKCIITIDNLRDEIFQQSLYRLSIPKPKNGSEGSSFNFQGDTRITHYVWEELNANQQRMRILSKSIYEYKTMYIHQLLKINEDFDDDLLKDAIDLLQVQSSNIENKVI